MPSYAHDSEAKEIQWVRGLYNIVPVFKNESETCVPDNSRAQASTTNYILYIMNDRKLSLNKVESWT